MVCVHCGGPTKVVNSRPQKRINQVWRRRRCQNCGSIFTSEELAQYGSIWLVKPPSGPIEPFDRDRLFLSLYEALGHRKAPVGDAAELTDTIIKKLLGSFPKEGLLSAETIKQIVQVALNRFDKAASTFYGAHHK
jgi:transcriptional repressor NrdR